MPKNTTNLKTIQKAVKNNTINTSLLGNHHYTIKTISNELKIGMMVETNATGGSYNKNKFITGEIGEENENSFYIWQNEHSGAKGNKNPLEKGYKYSWIIDKNNDEAWIKILNTQTKNE